MYSVQDKYTHDCDLIPHYATTTNGVAVVSFTSVTPNVGSITIQQDGHITVSTKTTRDSDNTQFNIIVSCIQTTKILNVLYNVCTCLSYMHVINLLFFCLHVLLNNNEADPGYSSVIVIILIDNFITKTQTIFLMLLIWFSCTFYIFSV